MWHCGVWVVPNIGCNAMAENAWLHLLCITEKQALRHLSNPQTERIGFLCFCPEHKQDLNITLTSHTREDPKNPNIEYLIYLKIRV